MFILIYKRNINNLKNNVILANLQFVSALYSVVIELMYERALIVNVVDDSVYADLTITSR